MTPWFWVELTYEWYEDAIVFRFYRTPYFVFLFRTNGKKEHLDQSNFHRKYGNCSESAILKVTWYQLCLKFFLNNYEAHW